MQAAREMASAKQTQRIRIEKPEGPAPAAQKPQLGVFSLLLVLSYIFSLGALGIVSVQLF